MAASPRVGRVTNQYAQVVSDVPYAKFIFYGTKHIEARPPEVHYTEDDLAEAVLREVLGDW